MALYTYEYTMRVITLILKTRLERNLRFRIYNRWPKKKVQIQEKAENFIDMKMFFVSLSIGTVSRILHIQNDESVIYTSV